MSPEKGDFDDTQDKDSNRKKIIKGFKEEMSKWQIEDCKNIVG